MKLATLIALAGTALALPVFEMPTLSSGVTPWASAPQTQHNNRLHKRVTTIAQNSGLSIGGIVGEALGEQVLSVLPKANDYKGLIDTLVALVGKANQKYVSADRQGPVETSIKHHNPDREAATSPIIRLLNEARDARPGPWGGVGAAIGSPIGKQIGKLMETA